MDPHDPRAPERFRSVGGEAIAELLIEKSRFLAYAAPVASEEEARQFIERVRTEHPESTHVVSAYSIGAGGLLMRFSDDGEPQGTAGVPTLEVLKREHLTDVVVATVRYFGGIKLGAGGLVRAYSSAAAEGVRAAGIVEMVRQERLEAVVDYPSSGALSYWLGEVGWPVETRYQAQVTYVLDVPAHLKERLVGVFAEKTGGQAELHWGALAYRPLPELSL